MEDEQHSLIVNDSLLDINNNLPSFEEDESITSSSCTSDESEEDNSSRPKSKWLLVAKVVLALSTLVCLIASKLTILEIGGRLYSLTNTSDVESLVPEGDIPKVAANLYWQLLFILWVPNIITILRCAWNGMFLGRRNLWPTPTLAQVIYVAVVTKFISRTCHNGSVI